MLADTTGTSEFISLPATQQVSSKQGFRTQTLNSSSLYVGILIVSNNSNDILCIIYYISVCEFGWLGMLLPYMQRGQLSRVK
jgi:hypothetical protein